MKMENTVRLSYKDLSCYTNNFSESNYIGHFQFGKLYRGKILRAEGAQYVMVKIWEVPNIYRYEPGDNECRLMNEIVLLRHEKLVNHPGMVKLYGFCCEGDHLGAVYLFKPFDSIFNLIPKVDFTWMQRIKVAIGIASVLKYLHTVKSLCYIYKPFIVRNLSCAHIVLDEDYKPKLCDFGLMSGGIFPDKTKYRDHQVLGCYGYLDPNSIGRCEFSDKLDVFAFGTILVSLIAKRAYNEEDWRSGAPTSTPYDWALSQWLEYETNPKTSKLSLVDCGLAADPEFVPADGRKLTSLVLDCIERFDDDRPTMKTVMKSLLKLKVVRKHGNFFSGE